MFFNRDLLVEVLKFLDYSTLVLFTCSGSDGIAAAAIACKGGDRRGQLWYHALRLRKKTMQDVMQRCAENMRRLRQLLTPSGEEWCPPTCNRWRIRLTAALAHSTSCFLHLFSTSTAIMCLRTQTTLLRWVWTTFLLPRSVLRTTIIEILAIAGGFRFIAEAGANAFSNDSDNYAWLATKVVGVLTTWTGYSPSLANFMEEEHAVLMRVLRQLVKRKRNRGAPASRTLLVPRQRPPLDLEGLISRHTRLWPHSLLSSLGIDPC